ncbi:MAG: phospholipid/cholesterol/gamma-HCH transport system ATP-binding protein [Thermoleophilaceae bacterium]|jgi:ABC-type transporter Mla maintaining outer membrane lipid asymmetry ATPase subunit MlaF|nr:phospholipid/cholesterol/gamma-HCH transport system ATP-binding protein [Thermoleophilaceae bacterium]
MAFSAELIDVHKRAGASRALTDVNIGVPSGDVTVLHGGARSGKTAVVRLISGLDRADHGAVLVGGKAMSGASGRALRRLQRSMAVMLQGGPSDSCGLFDSASIFENLAFPLRESGHVAARRIDALALDYLERAGLAQVASEKPAVLSPAMRKRVALVRALAMHAPLVVLDEPDGHADPAELETVCRLIEQEREERCNTYLVTTRNSALAARLGHHVVSLDDGCVVETSAVYA